MIWSAPDIFFTWVQLEIRKKSCICHVNIFETAFNKLCFVASHLKTLPGLAPFLPERSKTPYFIKISKHPTSHGLFFRLKAN